MRVLIPLLPTLLLTAALIGGVGCAATGSGRAGAPIADKPADPVTAADGLRQWWVPEASGALFVRGPSPGLERYRTYLIEPPLLHFRRLSAKPSRSESIRLSRNLAKVIGQRLESAFGWSEASEPGPEVVLVRAQASNIEFSSPDASAHTRTTALVSSGALVYFMLEMRDSQSDTPLLRFGVRRRLPGGMFTGPYWHEIDRARLVFRGFGIDMGPNLHSVAQN